VCVHGGVFLASEKDDEESRKTRAAFDAAAQVHALHGMTEQ
jgi:hypothetical protein